VLVRHVIMACQVRMCLLKKRIMNQESGIKKIKNKARGFTLIELLVAISIIGILSSFLLANFIGVRQRARDGVRKSDLRQIQSALELYRSDQLAYPNSVPNSTSASCLRSLLADPSNCSSVTYMKTVPVDPSASTNYQYNSAAGTTYCLRTCLENTNDNDRDEIRLGSNNPTITGCTLQSCASGKSYTLQNP
jgi:general secretion pathway protein G